jgi:hypothetical protein
MSRGYKCDAEPGGKVVRSDGFYRRIALQDADKGEKTKVLQVEAKKTPHGLDGSGE